MTKSDFVEAIVLQTGILKKDALSAFETVCSRIASALAEGDDVHLAGVGTLRTYIRAPKQARNPQTGEAITIAATPAVKFRTAKTLKAALQQSEAR